MTKADFIFDVVKTVVSRNDSTPSTDEYVQKLTNRDIERIIKQWQKKKPIPEIAKYFGVSRQLGTTPSLAINNQERFLFFETLVGSLFQRNFHFPTFPPYP